MTRCAETDATAWKKAFPCRIWSWEEGKALSGDGGMQGT